MTKTEIIHQYQALIKETMLNATITNDDTGCARTIIILQSELISIILDTKEPITLNTDVKHKVAA